MSEPSSWSVVGAVSGMQRRRGSLNVMSYAPFGYRYVSVREGEGRPDLNRMLSRRESFIRYSPGSDVIAAVSTKSAGDFRRRAS